MIYPSANMLNGNHEKDYINEAEKKETRTTKPTYCGYEINIVTEPQIFNPPKEMLVWDNIDDIKVKKVWAIAPKETRYRTPVHCVLFGECFEHCAEFPKELLQDNDYPPKVFLGSKRQRKILQDGSITYFYEVLGGNLYVDNSNGYVRLMVFKYNGVWSKSEKKIIEPIKAYEFEERATELINNVIKKFQDFRTTEQNNGKTN